MFDVTKAEIIDSVGRTSGEIDLVVYDQLTAAPCLNVTGERRVVKAESVTVTIEVKSRLDADTWRVEYDRLASLGALKRFFAPRPLLQTFASALPDWPESQRALDAGLSPLEDHMEIPAFVSAYFGFDGPSIAGIQSFVQTPGIDLVCVLGKYTVAKRRPGFDKMANGGEGGQPYIWAEGDDALGAFLVIIHALGRFRNSRDLVAPISRYYRPRAIEYSFFAIARAPSRSSRRSASHTRATTSARSVIGESPEWRSAAARPVPHGTNGDEVAVLVV